MQNRTHPRLYESDKLFAALALELVKVLPPGQDREEVIEYLNKAKCKAATTMNGR